jgi:hypothetical protein
MKNVTITKKEQTIVLKHSRNSEVFLEKIFPALVTEKALAKDWLSKEDEEAWKKL